MMKDLPKLLFLRRLPGRAITDNIIGHPLQKSVIDLHTPLLEISLQLDTSNEGSEDRTTHLFLASYMGGTKTQ